MQESLPKNDRQDSFEALKVRRGLTAYAKVSAKGKLSDGTKAPRLDKGPRTHLAGIFPHASATRGAQVAHRLPGSVLSQYRRGFLASHRDLHADWRRVHTQLPALRGYSWHSASAPPRRAAAYRG